MHRTGCNLVDSGALFSVNQVMFNRADLKHSARD